MKARPYFLFKKKLRCLKLRSVEADIDQGSRKYVQSFCIFHQVLELLVHITDHNSNLTHSAAPKMTDIRRTTLLGATAVAWRTDSATAKGDSPPCLSCVLAQMQLFELDAE